jgi:hypothetical protein
MDIEMRQVATATGFKTRGTVGRVGGKSEKRIPDSDERVRKVAEMCADVRSTTDAHAGAERFGNLVRRAIGTGGVITVDR